MIKVASQWLEARKYRLKPSLCPKLPFLIFDVSGTVEDCLALALGLRAAQQNGQKVLGVCVVHGQESLNKGLQRVLRVCSDQDPSIPVFRGSSFSLTLNTQFPVTQNAPWPSNDADFQRKEPQQLSAAEFIAESVANRPGEIGIITFGPLTNLALAVVVNAKVTATGALFITGGQCYGMGNVKNSCLQANFAFDPEAACSVIRVDSIHSEICQCVFKSC